MTFKPSRSILLVFLFLFTVREPSGVGVQAMWQMPSDDNMNKEVYYRLTNNKKFRFTWQLLHGGSDTCCCNVTNPEIFQDSNHKTTVNICYQGSKSLLVSSLGLLCSKNVTIDSNTYKIFKQGSSAITDDGGCNDTVSSSTNVTAFTLITSSFDSTVTPSYNSTMTSSQSSGTMTSSSSSSMTSSSSSTTMTSSQSSSTMTSSSSSSMTSSSSSTVTSSQSSMTSSFSSTMTALSSSTVTSSSSSTVTSSCSSSPMTSSFITSSTMTSLSSISTQTLPTTMTPSKSAAPQSSPIPYYTCSADGPWPLTDVGNNVTMSGIKKCFNGSVKALRVCDLKGIWSDVTCLVSVQFNKTLTQIKQSPIDGLETLSTMSTNFSSNEFVFLLDTVLDVVLESPGNVSDDVVFTERFLSASEVLISSSYSSNGSVTDDEIRRTGSQLLLTLDNFALNFLEAPKEIILDEIFLNVISVGMIQQEVPSINIDNNFITLPQEIFTEDEVLIASFLFPNLSHLLPPVNPDDTIISPIISSTIDCQSCLVSNLSTNVTITLQKESTDFTNQNISCVFYDFTMEEGILPTGDWNSSGCTTTINGDLVTCSCNHLTHFAILLSPAGPQISSTHQEVLNTLGLVLVPISLLCMVMVILTFALIRSLWSLRNYVHIMLCVSLFMAQLAFLLGIDKIKHPDICSAVAVILVYLFLVSFMWMLMEGVVLYVTLIRVFINNPKYYGIAFTVSSYVIPLLYMAIIVPIGYVVNIDYTHENYTHFLYYHPDDNTSISACWLNYSTGFIWSFIAPVIVIILVNIGFFIMAVYVMRKHTRKQHKSTKTSISHWLKASISLTLVMGISWIAGLLAFKPELLAVIYIITIFIAAQGILLFIILVVLSKQVREAYYKAWVTQKSQSAFFTKLSDLTTQSLLTGSLRPNANTLQNSNSEKHVLSSNSRADHGNRDSALASGNADSIKRDLLQESNIYCMETPASSTNKETVIDTAADCNHTDDNTTMINNYSAHVYEDLSDNSMTLFTAGNEHLNEPVYSSIQ